MSPIPAPVEIRGRIAYIEFQSTAKMNTVTSEMALARMCNKDLTTIAQLNSVTTAQHNQRMRTEKMQTC